ncbi:MAG: hypothetical protein Q9174_005723 [Haloplaca sp. 1 TL-2023]
MDSPDRMTWTPSSSAKKRKFDEIESPSQLKIPGAYPRSPPVSINAHRDQYSASPTPLSRFTNPMHGATNGGPLVQMVANKVTMTGSMSNVGMFGHHGARMAQMLRDTPIGEATCRMLNGPLYGIIDALGNAAKRIKLTIWPESEEKQASTPPPSRRMSGNLNVTPTRRSEASVLHEVRETSLRRNRQTDRWVSDQKFVGDVVRELGDTENAISDIPEGEWRPVYSPGSAPMMSGALPPRAPPLPPALPCFLSDDDLMEVDDDFSEFDSKDEYDSDRSPLQNLLRDTSPSSVSSDGSDSITSADLFGLEKEDLNRMESVQAKRRRERRREQEALAVEAKTRAANRKAHNEYAAKHPDYVLNGLRRLQQIRTQPLSPKKNVVFYQDPKTGEPVQIIKEYDRYNAITPPVKPYIPTTKASAPAIRIDKLRDTLHHEHRLPETPPKSGDVSSPSSTSKLDSKLSQAIDTPLRVKSSVRRTSGRQSDLEIAAQFERDQAAAEAQRLAEEEAKRKALEEAQEQGERIRLGVRRMPSGPVIEPLSSDWDEKVAATMRVGLSSSRELAQTSTGTPLNRRDLGHVLPQRGDDPSGWLNDNIILAYLQAVVDHGKKVRGVKRGELPKVHAFNSFLYNNCKQRGYDSVRNWATRAKFGGKNLLKMEKIFIPINKNGNHWVLVHINPQTKTIEYFDSFHGNPNEAFAVTKTWLAGELKEAWVDSEWTFLAGGGPLQNNASDCGVFLSTTAKMIVLGVDPMAFSAREMPLQRRRMVAELVNGGFEGEFAPNVVF